MCSDIKTKRYPPPEKVDLCLLRQIIYASHSTGPFELPKQDVLWFDLRENI